MTNDKLKSAIDVIGERLNELERLTALLSRFAAAAEAVLRYVPNVTERTELAECCRETYRAGIPPAGEQD